MTFSDKKYFMRKINEIAYRCPEVYKMQSYTQHGNTTTFEHCLHVSYLAYKMAIDHHYKVDIDSLIRGSFLHDFYLYDWHAKDNNEHRWHGFTHPEIARKTAKFYFEDLSLKEQSMIRTHMWPFTLLHLPLSKEAFILCVIDKCCSTYETFHRKNKEKI